MLVLEKAVVSVITKTIVLKVDNCKEITVTNY